MQTKKQSHTPLPEEFFKGIEQFNRQEFFECHESLETVWKDRKAPDRTFIQGIIQVSVGCHHLQRANFRGALSLFDRALPKLEPFKPSYGGLDIDALIGSISTLRSNIAMASSADIGKATLPRLLPAAK